MNLSSIFMIILLIIGVVFLYLELKSKEGSEKIFYTMYILVVGIVLVGLLSIINLLFIYIVFSILYTILLYGLYTDFDFLTYFVEIFILERKKVEKTMGSKVDYEYLDLSLSLLKEIKGYFKKITGKENLIIDYTIISILGILFILVLLLIK